MEAIANLTPAQRHQLQNPVVLASGAPGEPMALLQRRLNRYNPLYAELCKAGLIACAAGR